MTLKEKFNIRKSRINEYKEKVAKFCKIVSDCSTENNIRAEFNEYESEPIACMKTKVYKNEGGDPEYLFRYIDCSFFSNKEVCRMDLCPLHKANEEYIKHEKLVQQARSEKRAAFKSIFQRIK